VKLFLASFMQKENFGPGKIISICKGSKPKNFEVKEQFTPFIPNNDIIKRYYKSRLDNEKESNEIFVKEYQEQLQNIVKEIITESKDSGIPILDLLPFQDGDTLCSWERAEYTNYRKILAPVLEQLGYEVELN
jgi:hypothetical protein